MMVSPSMKVNVFWTWKRPSSCTSISPNLFGRLTFLRARDCKAAEVFHLLTAGVIGGAIPGQPNTVFRVGGLEAENLFGTRGLRRNRRRLHTASEEYRVGKRGNHE